METHRNNYVLIGARKLAIIRVGECLRCGMCCLLCEHIELTFQRERGKFKRLFGTCRILGTKERKDRGCDDYPTYPDRLLGKFCGYRFVDADSGKDVTTFRKNKALVILDVPAIEIVIKGE